MTKTERDALFTVAGGKSEKSGLPLSKGWEGDHIKPRAAGGIDDISNMQALTREENNSKSCGYVQLREWQQRFVDQFEASNLRDFLLVALPGAGKTIAALEAVRRWRRERPNRRRVLIVVPTDNLREQWMRTAHDLFGIELAVEAFTGDADVLSPGNYDGVVTTYQSVGTSPLVFRGFVSRYEFLVLFDEIHHAGDQANWGAKIKEAFNSIEGVRDSGVVKRLCMSGTPFRTDRTKIPFVNYTSIEPQMCRPDFTYDYPEALRDGVIRVVAFDHYQGAVSELDLKTGQEIIRELKQDQADEEATATLGLILQHHEWQRGMLKIANAKLEELRALKPNAGALALAKNIEHAEQISKILFDITGEQPALVVSDETKANIGIKEFSSSKKKWIVAVRQVSEGTDIPRLMVLAYLTNTCTELFFKQAVGRIVRYQGEDYDGQAFCYIPDHPRLIEFAQRIKESQCQSIGDWEEDDGDPKDPRSPFDKLPPRIVLNTWQPEFAGRIQDGEAFAPEYSKMLDSIAAEAKISMAQVLVCLRRAKELMPEQQILAPAQNNPSILEAKTQPLADRIKSIKRRIQRVVGGIAEKTGKEHRFIRAEANRYAENMGHQRETMPFLKAVLAFLCNRK